MRFNERGLKDLINSEAPGRQARLNDLQRAALAPRSSVGRQLSTVLFRWRLCDLAQ